MNTLYIVATPIGNLEDISFRAVRVLGEADYILCEDTRVTGKLLERYHIRTPVISYHQHSGALKTERVLEMLGAGKSLALVSDAGTPGISDPGGKLVAAAFERFGEQVKIESVPGPSAVTAALSISGIPTDKFIFMGFLPNKKGRQTMLKRIAESDFPAVVYESKYRIIKLLDELEALNRQISKENKETDIYNQGVKDKNRRPKRRPVSSVVVCRELSKMHETVYRGEPKTIKQMILTNKDEQKGEFTVIVGK